MGAAFIICGIYIYVYGQDHNPPHLHFVYSGKEYTITVKDRVCLGNPPQRILRTVNRFIDEHEA